MSFEKTISPSNVLFFLGAGASKPAEIGTTEELVKDFTSYLTTENLTELKSLLDEITFQLGKNLDIEKLMSAIDKLANRSDEDLLKFYDESTFKVKNSAKIPDLQNELEKFIQTITSVKSDKVGYLQPLLSFERPRRIFSVNYDTAIEQFCNVYNYRCNDGFQYEWNPNLFSDNDNYDFHLYKIHGSIMWYRTNTSNYVKLPLPPVNEIELIFGEKATPLILYPMQKWEFVEPLLDMLVKFQTSLQEIDFLIVIGYSFRDEHIVRIFHESARRNQKLILIFVSPSARENYEEKLKYYSKRGKSNDIASSLEGRVLCLEYKVENILWRLKEIVDKCREAVVLDKQFQKSILEGRPYHQDELLTKLSEIEFLDKANKIEKKIDWHGKFTLRTVDTKFMLNCFRLFLTAEIQEEVESANLWLKKFLTAFTYLNMRIKSNKNTVTQSGVTFPTQETWSGISNSRYDFENLTHFIESQKGIREDKFSPLLNDISNKLLAWYYSVACLGGTTLGYADYLREIKNTTAGFLEGHYPDDFHRLLQYIDETSYLIQNFEQNNEKVTSIVNGIQTSILDTLFGDSSLENYLKRVYPERVNN